MILSASRRTDIPNHYSDWLFNRFAAGHVLVPNPMNPHQIRRVELSREMVDCIVFWTKNPRPMLSRIDEIKDYPYYFQFTLNAYGSEIEGNIPPTSEGIETFQVLSRLIGSERVIWRYDPIFLSPKYDMAYHLEHFAGIAEHLNTCTQQCIISFVDRYRKVERALREHEVVAPTSRDILQLVEGMARICSKYGMSLNTCAETVDLAAFGVGHAHCIDGDLIERLIGRRIKSSRDPNQRPACGCVSSVDIGRYDTCRNRCIYCYANSPDSPMPMG